MAIEKAVVHGLVTNAVQVRNMFTCEVIEQGGDTSAILWEAYLTSVYDPIQNLAGSYLDFTEYEVFRLTGGEWVLIDTQPLDFEPGVGTSMLMNAGAWVLIGKALGIRKMGRKFFSGLPTTMVANNTLTVTGLVYAAQALAGYLTPFTGLGGGTITPGVWGKDAAFHPFVGGVVSAFLGTMRRRKPGVGI